MSTRAPCSGIRSPPGPDTDTAEALAPAASTGSLNRIVRTAVPMSSRGYPASISGGVLSSLSDIAARWFPAGGRHDRSVNVSPSAAKERWGPPPAAAAAAACAGVRPMNARLSPMADTLESVMLKLTTVDLDAFSMRTTLRSFGTRIGSLNVTTMLRPAVFSTGGESGSR